MSKYLYMETDGDRYPKDVYLVNESGERVATMEGHNELTMKHLALAISNAFNEAQKASNDFRYSHDEIEAACGGGLAMQVRVMVMKRRERILAENAGRKDANET